MLLKQRGSFKRGEQPIERSLGEGLGLMVRKTGNHRKNGKILEKTMNPI